TWTVSGRTLAGSIELPMAVSTVGPLVHAHPSVGVALRILGTSSARELAAVMAAVGLASNLAALRPLVTDGIPPGPMALPPRQARGGVRVDPGRAPGARHRGHPGGAHGAARARGVTCRGRARAGGRRAAAPPARRWRRQARARSRALACDGGAGMSAVPRPA